MEKSAKIGGTYLRQAVLVYSHTCFSPAIYMLLHFQKRRADSHGFKYCQKTATAGGDMLLSKQSRAPLATAKSTAYADFGAQAFLGADLVVVSS